MIAGMESLLAPGARRLSSDVRRNLCTAYTVYERPEKTRMGSKAVTAFLLKLESS
jgi:hypothetical protein